MYLDDLVGLAAIQVVNEYHHAWLAFGLVFDTPLLLLRLPRLLQLPRLPRLLQLPGRCSRLVEQPPAQFLPIAAADAATAATQEHEGCCPLHIIPC
jgi:hypothetical protein